MTDEKEHLAVRVLNRFGRDRPNLWNALNRVIGEEHKHNGFSLSQAQAYLALIRCGSIPPPPSEPGCLPPIFSLQSVAALEALGKWRASKGIYRLPDSLLNALLKTPVSGALPCELLRAMPEWCIYIELQRQIGGRWYEGVWAHVQSVSDGTDALRLLLLEDEDHFAASTLPLLDGSTIEKSYTWMKEQQDPRSRGHTDILVEITESVISVLLYLCSVNAEYHDTSGSDRQPAHPEPRIDKHGKPRFQPPNKPTIWATGTRMGAALDAAYSKQRETDGTATGRTVTGHIRRAHWSTYWTGPKDTEQVRVLKWLPPIPVNLDDVPTVATVRPVTGKRSPPEAKP